MTYISSKYGLAEIFVCAGVAIREAIHMGENTITHLHK